MAWWNRLFKKKEPIQQEEDWEQLVYTRNGVNFDEEDQRKRYIVNCLEQIAEASKEIDLLTGEYTLVTSYLTDTDEIEALPAEQREEVNRVAGKLAGADAVLAWPQAVISPLAPETAIQILWRDRLAAMQDPSADRDALAAAYAAEEGSPLKAAAGGYLTDVIAPEETKAKIGMLLEMLAGKRVSRLPKKHSNIQL